MASRLSGFGYRYPKFSANIGWRSTSDSFSGVIQIGQRPTTLRFRIVGGADRDRTGDPLVANQVLSQLSYSPT
jgi:hypothetical protein